MDSETKKTLHLETIGDDGSITKVDIILPVKVLILEVVLEIVGDTKCFIESDGWKGMARQHRTFTLSPIQQIIPYWSQDF